MDCARVMRGIDSIAKATTPRSSQARDPRLVRQGLEKTDDNGARRHRGDEPGRG